MKRIDPTTSRLLQLVRPSLLGALTLIAAAGCLGGGGSGGAQNSEEAAMDDEAEEDGTEDEGSNDPGSSDDAEPGANDADEEDADEEDVELGEDIGEDGSNSGSEEEDGESSGGSAGPAGGDGEDIDEEDIDADDASELTPEEIEAEEDDAEATDDEEMSSEDDGSSETEEDPEDSPGEVGPSEGSIVVDTGLPEDTPLTELSEEDRLAMCEQAGSAIDASRIEEAQCEMVGAFTAVLSGGGDDEFQAACLAAKEQCLADEAEETEEDAECSTEPVPDTCEATVGDLETCANQTFALLDSIKCSSSQAEVLLVLASAEGQQTSPECERMQGCSTSSEDEEALSGGL